MKNKNGLLYIACAGSGKTQELVTQAFLNSKDKKILISTFTDSNVEEIENRFLRLFGYIPQNISIYSWYSFELDNLIRPYQPFFIKHCISGINMNTNKNFYCKSNEEKFYLDKEHMIYHDRIARLSYISILTSEGKIINRIKRLWDVIYIDEDQDLSSFDFEVVGELLKSNLIVKMFGDPRQSTFKTDGSSKNRSWSTIDEYLIEKFDDFVSIDDSTLCDSYRCPSKIIEYASLIFPNYPVSHSKSQNEGDLFFVKEDKITDFLISHSNCVQLRYRKNTKPKVSEWFKAMNIGLSKGRTFDNVLLYLTDAMRQALSHNDFSLMDSDDTKCLLYVAITRTKGDCGIVVPLECPNFTDNSIIKFWTL